MHTIIAPWLMLAVTLGGCNQSDTQGPGDSSGSGGAATSGSSTANGAGGSSSQGTGAGAGGHAPSATMKWNPGHYLLSVNWDGTGADNNTEIGVLADYGDNIQGYVAEYSWANLEPAQGQYNIDATLGADFLELQKVKPGAKFGFYIGGNRDIGAHQITAANVAGYKGSGFIPNYILDCNGMLTSTDGTMTGAVPISPNGSRYGFWVSQYNKNASPPYYHVFVGGHVWHPIVNQCFINLWQAIAKTKVPNIPGMPQYDNLTYDEHPLIELVGLQDEFSIALAGGFAGSPQGDGDSAPTSENARKRMVDLMLAARAAFPHTNVVSNYSYGIYGTDGMETYQGLEDDLMTMYQGRVALGGSDVLGNFVNEPVGSKMSAGFSLFMGNTYSPMSGGASGGTLVPNGGTDLRGKMPFFAQVQGDDYDRGTKAGTTIDTQQAVSDIYDSAVKLHADHFLWCLAGGKGPQAYTTGFWKDIVYPVVKSLPTPYAELPEAYQ